jgi:hypothetical protein
MRLFVPLVAAIRRLAWGDDGTGRPSGLGMTTSSCEPCFGEHSCLPPHFVEVEGDVVEESILEPESARQRPIVKSRARSCREGDDGISQMGYRRKDPSP